MPRVCVGLQISPKVQLMLSTSLQSYQLQLHSMFGCLLRVDLSQDTIIANVTQMLFCYRTKKWIPLQLSTIVRSWKLEPQSLHECFCEDTYSMLDMLLRMAVSITTFGNIDLSHLKVTIRHKFLVIRRTKVTQTARLIGWKGSCPCSYNSGELSQRMMVRAWPVDLTFCMT